MEQEWEVHLKPAKNSPVRQLLNAAAAGMAVILSAASALAQDALPSWNEPARSAILDFVDRTTTEGSAEFVQPPDRIAVFDNDGTLWSEQPVYFQAAFIFDRIRALAPDHPQWKDQQPYKAVLEGDMAALHAAGEKGLLTLLGSTHFGMSVDAFAALVRQWAETARHPKTGRLYTQMTYQPMIELLEHLRGAGYQTWIVSGGGVEFMRPWAPKAYGIPPQQIVGSSGKTEFKLDGDKPEILKLPEVEFIDDGPGKPVGINRFIGRRPVFAAGNSDGDLQMLQWTTLGEGPRFGMIVHHTDAEREWAYDRNSPVGKLDKALDEAPRRGWLLVDMKRDWKVIYPEEK